MAQKRLTLWKVMLGYKPVGCMIEQHDVAFVVGERISDTIPALKKIRESESLHVVSYTPIRALEDYEIYVTPTGESVEGAIAGLNLFFFNLGGYKKNDPEKYHKRILKIGRSLADLVEEVRLDSFFFHHRVPESFIQQHVDDKYGIDSMVNIANCVPEYKIHITKKDPAQHILQPVINGCFPLAKSDPFNEGISPT